MRDYHLKLEWKTHKKWNDNNNNNNRKKEQEILIQAVRIYIDEIGLEFGIEKYAMHIMKSVKGQMTEGTELPNQEKNTTLRKKETYKYLWILEADMIKQVETKGKI